MKKRNGKVYASLLLGMVLLLSACSGQPAAEQVQGSAAEATVSDASASQKEEAAAGEERTVTHAMGTTNITGTPQKIVVLDNGH
jgi:iron complex transport system substrate-binding protein